MQSSAYRVTHPQLDEKLFQFFLMLHILKGLVKWMVLGAIATSVLTVFSLLAAALCELTTNISQLWQASDSLSRLFLLCLVVYSVKKSLPYIVTLHTKGLL